MLFDSVNSLVCRVFMERQEKADLNLYLRYLRLELHSPLLSIIDLKGRFIKIRLIPSNLQNKTSFSIK